MILTCEMTINERFNMIERQVEKEILNLLIAELCIFWKRGLLDLFYTKIQI